MTARYDYSAWDGTQEFTDLDVDDLLAGLTDDLLTTGDLDDALRRLLRSGIRTADGEQIPGLRDLLEQLRRRRAELLARATPTAAWRRSRRSSTRLRPTNGPPSTSWWRMRPSSGDDRRVEVTDDVATERRMALDLQPADPAGRLQSLQHYDFVSSEARQQLRGAARRASPRDGGHLLRGSVRGALVDGARADGPHAGRLRRAEPDARAARAGRRPRPELRAVHGAVRRHVPGQPLHARRAAGAARRAHGGRPGRLELALARAAGAAAWADGGRSRGHGSALAGGAPGPEPAAGGSRSRVAAVLRFRR